MSTTSRTLPFVCALVTLFASHARAQEYTFVYEATVTSAEVGAPASVGEKMRITFTFDSSVYSPLLYGYTQYPLVSATGRVGTKSWSFDRGSIYVTDNADGGPGMVWDAYTVVLGEAQWGVTPVEFVLSFYSEGTPSVPPQGVTSIGVPTVPPNPSAFQSKRLAVQSWKPLSAIVGDYISATANAPVVVPTCVVQQNLKMTGRSLTVEYRLGSTESGTLNLFLTSDSATRRLFSVPFGPSTEAPMNLPLPGDLPFMGVVGFLTTITTNQRGIVCWDSDIIDTGRPSP